MEELDFLWLEEPLHEHNMHQYQDLCRELDMPVMATETLMHDIGISTQWLMHGVTDLHFRLGRRPQCRSLCGIPRPRSVTQLTEELPARFCEAFGRRQVHAIEANLIQDYLAKLKGRGGPAKPETCNRHPGKIHYLFAWLCRQGDSRQV